MRGKERRVWGVGNGMADLLQARERMKAKGEAQAGGDQVVERPTRCWPGRPGSLGRAGSTLIIADGTIRTAIHELVMELQAEDAYVRSRAAYALKPVINERPESVEHFARCLECTDL